MATVPRELHSPVRVNRFSPLKSGNGVFEIDCFHPLAPDGHHSSVYRLQTLNRGQQGLMARHVEHADSLLYFTDIDFSWMQQHYPGVVYDHERVHESLERTYSDGAGALIQLLQDADATASESLEGVQHWGSEPYWTEAFTLLDKLEHKRQISLDLQAIRKDIYSGESIAYQLVDAMVSVKKLEGWEGFRGAPRLLLLTLAHLEELSHQHSSDSDIEAGHS